LPRETIFVAQIQDFNRARDEWQHCDIYQLYREPAVQDFLRKPLGNAPKTDAVSQTLLEIEQLAPKNAFVALTSIDNNNPKIVGGFRFRGSQEEAERIIGKWRSMLMGQNSSLKHEKVQYQGHEIEVTKAAAFSIATAYDPPWFFVGTDVPDVQALLDRADRRSSSSDNRLDKDETYRAAISRRPSNDVAFFYLQPKTFSQRLAALRTAVGSTPPPGEGAMLEKMRCITGSMRFENGKIHDVFFLGMPKLEQNTTFTRSSLSLGTKETFLYLAMLLNLGERMDTLNQVAAFAGTKIFQALSDSGITAADWKAAFGIELGSLGNWPSSARWPSLLVTLPVTDATKAGQIVEALLRAEVGGLGCGQHPGANQGHRHGATVKRDPRCQQALRARSIPVRDGPPVSLSRNCHFNPLLTNPALTMVNGIRMQRCHPLCGDVCFTQHICVPNVQINRGK
jgi:hypothetical protein